MIDTQLVFDAIALKVMFSTSLLAGGQLAQKSHDDEYGITIQFGVGGQYNWTQEC